MARIKGKCIGDCSRCELLAAGEVDMIPCVLDQIFARVRRQGAELEEIRKIIDEQGKVSDIQLAGLDESSIVETDDMEEEA